MKRLSFWKHPRLAQVPKGKLPVELRILYRNSTHRDQAYGSGPRTLDSVLSYIPRNSMNNAKIFVCLAQRDFPINLHHRMMVLLMLKNFNLQNVHFVITFKDQLNDYLKPINEDWRQILYTQLKTYINGFKLKVGERSTSNTRELLFQTLSDDHSIESKLNNYHLDAENVHLCDLNNVNDEGIRNLLSKIENPNEVIYCIGQTNSGKSKLIENIRKLSDELEITSSGKLNTLIEENLHQYLNETERDALKVSKFPFTSNFKVLETESLKFIDTPGYTRTGGSIFNHVSKNGCSLLELSGIINDTQWKNMCRPRHFKIDDSEWISFGNLLFIKPKVKSTGTNIKVIKNMPGSVKLVNAKERHLKMHSSVHNKLISNFKWSKYTIEGDEIDLILDNMGSLKVVAEGPITEWEIYAPSKVRLLSRTWSKNMNGDNQVSFKQLNRANKI